MFIDRVLLPRTGAAARPVLETAVDLLILELLALGLLTALNGAFALRCLFGYGWARQRCAGVAGAAPRPRCRTLPAVV
mgnify:CR=1 FL=1